MRVLHVTNWFPNESDPNEAVWIKNHIDSLPSEVDRLILHFEVKPSSSYKLIRRSTKNLKQTILYLPIKRWFLIEVIHLIWLYYQFIIKRVHKNCDIINFHIAYPMLTYWHLVKKNVRIPVVITEHWSAYHFNFGVNKSLNRIERIFQQRIPLIAVSNSLVQDLIHFSNSKFPFYTLPNSIDQNIFHLSKTIKREDFFFMVSKWSSPKNPFIVLKAFKKFKEDNQKYKLVIAGYGEDYDTIKTWAQDNSLSHEVVFPGKLDSKTISDYMRKCKAFIHCSNYETFSVVCAEALSCHAPVIASEVGGIREMVTNENGILLKTNDPKDWANALQMATKKEFQFDRLDYLSKEKVGQKYKLILKELI